MKEFWFTTYKLLVKSQERLDEVPHACNTTTQRLTQDDSEFKAPGLQNEATETIFKQTNNNNNPGKKTNKSQGRQLHYDGISVISTGHVTQPHFTEFQIPSCLSL